MQRFDRPFLQTIKNKLDVELLGAARIDEAAPPEMTKCAEPLLPGAASVVVLGKEIYKEIVTLLQPTMEVGGADPGALLKPHYAHLNGRLNRAVYDLCQIFHRSGYRALPLSSLDCPTDQRTLIAIFPYKHAAVAAGLGTIGRNGLLITEEYGPRVRLACVLTDAPIEPSSVSGKHHCTECNACIDACPAKALHEPKDGEFYGMNKFACRTYRQTGLTCSLCMKACAAVHG